MRSCHSWRTLPSSCTFTHAMPSSPTSQITSVPSRPADAISLPSRDHTTHFTCARCILHSCPMGFPLLASYSRKVLFNPVATNMVEHGDHEPSSMLSVHSCNLPPTALPFLANHIPSVPYLQRDTIRSPSGDHEAYIIVPVCSHTDSQVMTRLSRPHMGSLPS